MRISKRMKDVKNKFSSEKTYSLDDAIANLEKFPTVKFDETVELHFNLNVNPKSSDQMVRGTVSLPHGTGKTKRIAVFCKGEMEFKAKEAGADYVGSQELIDKVAGGFLEFDAVIASP
ncbi:MAG: 50S ribosomal protein L1, partial [Candidatus Omnitrophica bacterium]|nr:50S ribosomal protein L1 [Candidatus Omnitrophota bacterium]